MGFDSRFFFLFLSWKWHGEDFRRKMTMIIKFSFFSHTDYMTDLGIEAPSYKLHPLTKMQDIVVSLSPLHTPNSPS